MSSYITNQVEEDGVKVASGDWDAIQKEAGKHHRAEVIVRPYTEAKEWSEGQRKWFKGILLPALVADTGDSLLCWENRLKKEVMPDDFPTISEVIDGETYKYLPSITTLGIKKMNIMVEGSVDYLRDKGFDWVTLPDKELRK